MPSTDKVKDFTAFGEHPYGGMIVPEMFNDTGDDGSGTPGLQRAIKNYFYDYLHSGSMGSGIHMAGEDITGVNLLYADGLQTELAHAENLVGADGKYVSGYTTGVFSLADVINLEAISGVIQHATISPREASDAPFESGTQDGELFWDTVSESLYRWETDIGAWIEIGT